MPVSRVKNEPSWSGGGCEDRFYETKPISVLPVPVDRAKSEPSWSGPAVRAVFAKRTLAAPVIADGLPETGPTFS